MRKHFLAALCALALLIPIRLSAQERISVVELREELAAAGRWAQTYTAHGRTIEIDIPIIVPEVDRIPIIVCEDWKRFDKPWRDQYFSNSFFVDETVDYVNIEIPFAIEHVEDWKEDRLSVYISDNVSIAMVANDILAKMNRLHSKDGLKRIYRCFYPWELELNGTYAEDNPLTLEQATSFLSELLRELYGEEVSFNVHWIDTMSRGRITNGQKEDIEGKIAEYFPMGSYALTCNQTFHGIPIVQRGWEKFNGTWPWLAESERLSLAIMDEDSWTFGASLKKEIGTVVDDVPLIPVQNVIQQLEKMIVSGNIRDMYSLELGYCLFMDSQNVGQYHLFPVWKCECSYLESAKKEIWNDGSVYTSEAYRMRGDYDTFVFNAQTGEPIGKDVGVVASDFYCPDIITWP